MTLRRWLIFLALLSFGIWLAACGQTTDNRPQTTDTPIAASPTLRVTPSPTFLPTSTSTLLPSSTPIPCDPSAGYCIKDGSFVLQRPIAPSGNDTVDRTYPYGSTEGGTREPHHGVEFENASGTPVLAAAGGTVVYAGEDSSNRYGLLTDFYGNLIVIKHDLSGTPYGTLYTLYGHLSKIDVITGQSVTAGQKIGEVGRTGAAVGSHLHFEVRLEAQDYGSTLNPELWLAPSPGTGVLAIRLVDETGNFMVASLDIKYYPDPNGAPTQRFQPEIYAAELRQPHHNWENALLGDLTPGRYRIAFLWEGVIQECWVVVQAGKLTRTEFIVK